MSALQAFGRDRDQDDFQRLWWNFLQRHSPEALLGSSGAGTAGTAADSTAGVSAPACQTRSAIPTLLLSTNGASPADRLDLHGAFATYLREQHVGLERGGQHVRARVRVRVPYRVDCVCSDGMRP